MKRTVHYFIAQEDTNLYNVFSYDDFNEDGFYREFDGHEGYHIDDFDIIAEFETFEQACDVLDILK